MTIQSTHLTPDQLKAAVDAAAAHFSLIRKKYPNLDAYVVFSIPGAQTGIRSSPREIAKELPAMIVDGSAKSEFKVFLKQPEPKDATEKQKKAIKEEYDRLSSELSYHSAAFIELRFGHLDYDLIDQLRTDDLVNRKLTPQTRASIRIVLGTAEDFMA